MSGGLYGGFMSLPISLPTQRCLRAGSSFSLYVPSGRLARGAPQDWFDCVDTRCETDSWSNRTSQQVARVIIPGRRSFWPSNLLSYCRDRRRFSHFVFVVMQCSTVNSDRRWVTIVEKVVKLIEKSSSTRKAVSK